MDKEKEIEEMAMGIAECNRTHCEKCVLKCRAYITCEILHKKGYGNVKQAVKEFAEKLRKKAKLLHEPNGEWYENVHISVIDDLITELYGEEESPCEGCEENNNLEWDERTCPRRKLGLCKKKEGEGYGDGTKHH